MTSAEIYSLSLKTLANKRLLLRLTIDGHIVQAILLNLFYQNFPKILLKIPNVFMD